MKTTPQLLTIFLLAVLLLPGCSPALNQPRLSLQKQVPPAGTEPLALSQLELNIDAIIAACPTAEEVAFIDAHSNIVFLDDPTAPDLLCFAANGSADLTLLEKNLYNIFRVMQGLSFDEPLPWTDETLFDWFTQAVNGVVFDPDAEFSRCCDAQGRIHIQTEYLLAAQTHLWIDSYHGGAGLSSLLGILVHEARHNEGYPHLCTTSLGNDRRLEDMGAWGVEHYLYLWVSDHSQGGFFTEYHREIAHGNSLLIADTRICDEAAP